MALTSTEEALVRELLAQQASILSLAGNESTITSKLGATKVTLSDLASASAVDGSDLLLLRQATSDKSVTPNILKAFMSPDASETVKGLVELATSAETIAGVDTSRAVHPAGLSAALLSALLPAGSIIHVTQSTAPSGFLKANGAAVSRSTYSALFAAMNGSFTSQNFTVTIASPGVFTKTAHGFTGGERVRLSTTGALPTGLNTATDYYVLYVSANTFRLATTFGGTAINTSGTQSGTHSYLQSLFGLGDGTTTFTLPDLRGETLRGWDDARGIDTGRSIGTNQNDALQDITGAVGFMDDGLPAGVYSATGAFALGTVASNTILNGSSTTYSCAISATFDASRVARTANETRARNLALLACIKY